MTEIGKAMQDVRAQVLVVRGLTSRMHKASTENEQKYFTRKLQQETTMLTRAEHRARQLMDDMKPEMYVFCSMYYLSAMSLEDVAEVLDRSTRQCARYKRKIENE